MLCQRSFTEGFCLVGVCCAAAVQGFLLAYTGAAREWPKDTPLLDTGIDVCIIAWGSWGGLGLSTRVQTHDTVMLPESRETGNMEIIVITLGLDTN